MRLLNNTANKALHLTAIPLRSIAAGELGRYTSRSQAETCVLVSRILAGKQDSKVYSSVLSSKSLTKKIYETVQQEGNWRNP